MQRCKKVSHPLLISNSHPIVKYRIVIAEAIVLVRYYYMPCMPYMPLCPSNDSCSVFALVHFGSSIFDQAQELFADLSPADFDVHCWSQTVMKKSAYLGALLPPDIDELGAILIVPF